MRPSGGMAARVVAREDLRGIDLIAGDADVFEVALGEAGQLTGGRAVLPVGTDPGKKKSDKHGDSPSKAEAWWLLMLARVSAG